MLIYILIHYCHAKLCLIQKFKSVQNTQKRMRCFMFILHDPILIKFRCIVNGGHVMLLVLQDRFPDLLW